MCVSFYSCLYNANMLGGLRKAPSIKEMFEIESVCGLVQGHFLNARVVIIWRRVCVCGGGRGEGGWEGRDGGVNMVMYYLLLATASGSEDL